MNDTVRQIVTMEDFLGTVILISPCSSVPADLGVDGAEQDGCHVHIWVPHMGATYHFMTLRGLR